MSIFTLKPLHEKAYELSIKCAGSDKSFIFTQQQDLNKGEILDVYSQNGFVFTSSDEKGVKNAAKKLALATPHGPVVFVLDIKDAEKSYLDLSTISKCEEAVCSFFEQNMASSTLKHANKIHALLSSKLSHIICEGSLKAELVKTFSEAQADYLLNTPAGAIDFCQITEFFMNGFKFGQEAPGILAQDYICSLSDSAFKPCESSTVWYPALYEKVYAPTGAFAQSLMPVFSVSGSLDAKSKITTLTMEMKV